MYGSISASQRAAKFREYREYREHEKREKEVQSKKKADEEKEEKKAKEKGKNGCSCNTAWYQRFTKHHCHCLDFTGDCLEGFDDVVCEEKKDIEK
jgi:hypothetical protein